MKATNHTHTYFTNIPYSHVEEDVLRAHSASAEKYGWTHLSGSSVELSGKYGHDTLATSSFFALAGLAKVSSRYTMSPSQKVILTNEIAEFIHEGWSVAFKVWSEGKPWEKETEPKRNKPFKLLGGNDDERVEFSKTRFRDLPPKEQEKDLVIAKALVDHFTTPTGTAKWCPYITLTNNYYWIKSNFSSINFSKIWPKKE